MDQRGPKASEPKGPPFVGAERLLSTEYRRYAPNSPPEGQPFRADPEGRVREARAARPE